MARVEAVTHGDGDAHGEAFAGFDGEDFHSFVARVIGGGGGKNLVANVVEFGALDQGSDQVRSGVKRAGADAGDLADAHGGVAVGDHENTFAEEAESGGDGE